MADAKPSPVAGSNEIALHHALAALLNGVKLCPCCDKENECYVFSMRDYLMACAALTESTALIEPNK